MWSSADRQYPDIHGDIVVWKDEDSESHIVLGYNLRTKELFLVRRSNCEIYCPRISGHYIVWKEEEPDKQNGWLFTLLAYELRTKILKTVCKGIDSYDDIDISGDIVVWDHYSERSGSEIFGCNLSAGNIFRICTALYLRDAPKISDHTVIWCDDRPQGWLDKLLRKEPCQIRGKIFRHWPGEEK